MDEAWHCAGAVLVLHRHCAVNILVLEWYYSGNALVLHVYCMHTRLWCCTSTALVLCQTTMALYCNYTGTALMRHCAEFVLYPGTVIVPHTGTVLAPSCCNTDSIVYWYGHAAKTTRRNQCNFNALPRRCQHFDGRHRTSRGHQLPTSHLSKATPRSTSIRNTQN